MARLKVTLPPLIALASDAPQSGKTTAANILIREYGYEPHKFAAPLKQMIRALLASTGMSPEEIEARVEGHLKDEPIPQLRGAPCRSLMVVLGTNWGREMIYSDLWVDVACSGIRQAIDSGLRVVVDDMRFINEYQTLRAIGAVMVKVTRPDHETPEGSTTEGLLKDQRFDIELPNDGTQRGYEDTVRSVMEQYNNA